MKSVRIVLLASLIGVSTGVALAQPASSPAGPGRAASAPGMGMGMGNMGMGMGGGHGAARAGSDHTPGWSMMTPQERNEHRERMGSMKSYDECKTFRDQHHEQMAARAAEKGGKALAQPRRDACSALKK